MDQNIIKAIVHNIQYTSDILNAVQLFFVKKYHCRYTFSNCQSLYRLRYEIRQNITKHITP